MLCKPMTSGITKSAQTPMEVYETKAERAQLSFPASGHVSFQFYCMLLANNE